MTGLTPPLLRDDCFAMPRGAHWTPVPEALDLLRARLTTVTGTETVAVPLAAGRVLAEAAVARRAHPPAGLALLFDALRDEALTGHGAVFGALGAVGGDEEVHVPALGSEAGGVASASELPIVRMGGDYESSRHIELRVRAASRELQATYRGRDG